MRQPWLVARAIGQALHYGVATRRATVVVALAIGLLLVAISLAAQAAAPLAIYPFA